MAQESNKSSYQSLGKGVYRVGAVQRSAVTGRYVVPKAASKEASRTTSTENKGAGTTAKKR